MDEVRIPNRTTLGDTKATTLSPFKMPRIDEGKVIRLGVLLANVCTPVRLAIYPWIATVIQGVIDMYEGVSMGNACLPLRVAVLRGLVVVMPVARGEEVPPVLRSNMHRMLNLLSGAPPLPRRLRGRPWARTRYNTFPVRLRSATQLTCSRGSAGL